MAVGVPTQTAGPRPTGVNPAQPVPAVPFVAAAHEHTEPIFDISVTPGANAQNLQQIDVPSYGYGRNILLEVTATGGVLGTGALGADYPWNLFSSIGWTDVNGAGIFGPMDGYAAFIANCYGGYAFNCDPRDCPWYVGTINAQFPLRIPMEISHHDGLGSVANQNSAASYRIPLVINSFANMMTTVGTATPPTFRIRGFLEAWSLPNETDIVGRPQAQTPPAHGTLQYWSYQTEQVGAGNITVELARRGNLIRNLIVIARNAAGARIDTPFPSQPQLQWDARSLLEESQNVRTMYANERHPNLVARDTGVFAYNFNHSSDNKIGDDNPTLWLPTVQSSRLEFRGQNTLAGSLQILTNDIAPGEVIPSERYVETSETGFHPQIGISSNAAQ